MLLFGAVGALLCVAGSLGVWYVESRIDRAQERVFKRVDQSLEGIDRRLVETQNLAAQSKITVEEIRQRMQDWTKKEASERLATKFGVEAKVQQLASGLHQAELILERSQDAVEHVRQVLDASEELGISLNADSIGPLLERIEDIKEDLKDAIDTRRVLCISWRAAATLGKNRWNRFPRSLPDCWRLSERLIPDLCLFEIDWLTRRIRSGY